MLQAMEPQEEEVERIQADTYLEYHPPKLRSGLPHPDIVVETVSLSSVSSPNISYCMAIPEQIIDTGCISALQLEAALYACQAHERYLPSGERLGYLIGDGAGVGKGRTIAAIIYENYLLGRKRAIWLSVSSDLKFDAERDLRDVHAPIEVHALNKMKYAKINSAENGYIKKGVIFATYSSLIGESRNPHDNANYKTRFRQIKQWCGEDFDGVIVFDECHRAKNLCPINGGKSTKTGRFVLELQSQLPLARIVYASATGASEPRNMAYMTRLGLWGQGQTFTTFNDFIYAVENRGVGAMEMVAMDMKLRGLYLARQLSFKGVGFHVEEIELSDEFIKVYDESVRVWMECRRQFARAFRHIPEGMNRVGQKIWAQFWGAHQRFFKLLCISAKVDACVEVALKAIDDGNCVVIGLQSTGEAQMLDQLEESIEVNEFVSTAKGVLQALVEKHFPSYDDDRVSAMDDFNRLFLSADGGRATKRRQNNFAPSPTTATKRMRHSSINEYSNDDEEDEDEEEEESEVEEEEGSVPEEEENSPEHSQQSQHMFDALLAELGSDDSGAEEEAGASNSNASAHTFLSEAKENSTINDPAADDINPFCTDFTKEDPWACKQQSIDEPSLATPALPPPQPPRPKKQKKPASAAAYLPAKRSHPTFTAAQQASADEFIDSTNLINCAEDDDDGSINLTEIKMDLLAAIERLGRVLPPNTLDRLILQLGGPQFVAEMTGRRGRMGQDEAGNVQYELRNAQSEAPIELMNLEEKKKFLKGEKLVAVISEAASSGISLQSDRREVNQRRRVHITLELPWSADKAIQQFGRTHRSNQVSPPEYLFLTSALAGERRFASIVAKRLESLGALTHGDRRASDSRDLSQFNVDTKYGREALEVLLRTIVGAMQPLIPPPASYTANDFFTDMRTYLHGVGMLSRSPNGIYTIERATAAIPKFLNRLLGLPVHAQNSLFLYFSEIVDELIKQAKLDGTYDLGILDIGVGQDRVQKAETRTFHGSLKETNDFHVEMHKIILQRGVSWEEALSIRAAHRGKHEGFYVSKSMGTRKKASIVLVYGVGRATSTTTSNTTSPANANDQQQSYRSYCLTRPNTGRSAKPEDIAELHKRFERIGDEEARSKWEEQYQKLDQMCHHRYYYNKCHVEQQKGQFCEVGRRTRTYFILSGSVICVWPALEEILSEKGTGTEKGSDKPTASSSSSKTPKRMQIVRVRTDTNHKVVGLLVMPTHVRKLVELLERQCGPRPSSK